MSSCSLTRALTCAVLGVSLHQPALNLGLEGDVGVSRVNVAAVLGDVHARALDIGRGAEDARELEGHEKNGAKNGHPHELDEDTDELDAEEDALATVEEASVAAARAVSSGSSILSLRMRHEAPW